MDMQSVELPHRHVGRFILQVMTSAFLLFVFFATATANGQSSALRNGTPTIIRNTSALQASTPTATAIRFNHQFSPTQVAIPRAGIPGQTQYDGNTVALYHFDEPSGLNAIDASGSFTATLYGNAVITTSGLYAGVLTLDGNNSFVRTGNLGEFPEGTIEGFVDFHSACASANGLFTIFDFVNEGAGQSVLFVGVNPNIMTNGATGLIAAIYANGQWWTVDSGINPCRYLNGPNPPAASLWPYETWRFHHVAVTWGPRGLEIWVDGVLHGVGVNPPEALNTHHYNCNPQMQLGMGGPPPNPLYPVCQTPVMAPLMPAYPPGDFTGGLPAYTTFLIGCDNAGSCFKGRIDEVRISNNQRVFSASVDPTVTPTPTQTPDKVSGEYPGDTFTQALYHLNSAIFYGNVFNDSSQQWDGSLRGNASITQTGHYNGGLSVDGNFSYVYIQSGAPGAPQGTIEAWIKPDSDSPRWGILGAGSDPLGSPIWEQLFLGKYYANTPNLQFVFITYSDGWKVVDSGIPASSLVGCWHHVASTWGARGVEIWIDGKLRTTDPYFGSPYIRNYMDHFVLGCSPSQRCMSGKIDEVRISNVQRSFSPPLYRPNPDAPMASGTMTFFPMILSSGGCQYP
ncbi:MAG: hypothetical protein HZB51_14935 [Chloroflexi bacterium]|nr:hypothetical protein [Chloroflexota bacterium]